MISYRFIGNNYNLLFINNKLLINNIINLQRPISNWSLDYLSFITKYGVRINGVRSEKDECIPDGRHVPSPNVFIPSVKKYVDKKISSNFIWVKWQFGFVP